MKSGAITGVPPSQSSLAKATDAVFLKISWRILPILVVSYMIAYLDRVNIGYAQLQMKQTLPWNNAVYGLGAGTIPDASQLPGEAGEIVRDLAEITHAGVDVDQDEEANESAYAELVEFVRVGVQLLFEELAGARRPAGSASPLH